MTKATLGKIALALAGLGLGLGGAELALRAAHPTLPSLEALARSDTREVGEFMRWSDPARREAGCVPAPDQQRLHYRQRSATYAPAGMGPDPSALRLWVAGDSLVAGWGVGPDRAWPHGLARGAAEALGRRVQLTTVGGGGLGYCEILQDLHILLARSKPDLIVVQVFADDLEQRALLLLEGGVVARPDLAPGALAWLARRSWLANRVWFAQVSRLGGAEPIRALDDEGRADLERAWDLLEARAREQGAEVLFALVPPAGIERCAAGDPSWSDCDWLSYDQGWLAEALRAGGHRWVDLRGIWAQHDPETLPDEEAAWEARGRLPVHPGLGGHRAIVEATLPAVVEAARAAPKER